MVLKELLRYFNMKIKEYKPTKNMPKSLQNFLRKNYGKEKNFNLFLGDYIKSYNFCINNENIEFIPILISSNKNVSAHIALIIDRRLPKGTAFFGFMEVLDDVSVFNALWKKLIEVAKENNVSVLKGPVNGSIWHLYRCIRKTDGSDFFKTELMSNTYYYDFINSQKPNTSIEYYSAYREKFSNILPKIETTDKKLTSLGFSITEMKQIDLLQLVQIAKLSTNVFSSSWGYTELTKNEFLNLYSSDKIEDNLNKLYLLYKDKEVIGYCSTIKEDGNTLICKTICIIPEYQGLGLGNALAYKVHIDAIKDGYKKIIYALIREDNKVKNFPKMDTVVFRRYSAFEFRM